MANPKAKARYGSLRVLLIEWLKMGEVPLGTIIFRAINYHDSPLLKYAGANATSGAILNKKKTHNE